MSNFKKHNPKINRYAQKSPDNLKHVIMMVALSIQQPWYQIGNQMQDYVKKGKRSRFVWGNKERTLSYLNSNSVVLYDEAMAALKQCKGSELDIRLMDIFLKVDGLGLAKAGFVCQLFAGRVGCIDIHNARRLKGGESICNLSVTGKEKLPTRLHKIEQYVDFCKQRRCSWLWDSWCNLIWVKNPERFSSAKEVSEVHYSYLPR